jgi:hypothetical protein
LSFGSDLHYVSLGKVMYTQRHVVLLVNDSGFGLDRYAFTAPIVTVVSLSFARRLGRSKISVSRLSTQVGFNPRR